MTKRQPLSDGETELMKSVWTLVEATVPNLVLALNKRRQEDPITRGTIQVLLNRIEAKGWLNRKKVGRGYVYEASVSEADGLAELASQFRAKVFDGSSLRLVQSLVNTNGLKKEDIAHLRALLDRTEASLKERKGK